MGSIGSWYVRSVPAEEGESVDASFSANFLRKEARPLGGRLYLTSARVLFTPHLIDAWLGGEGYERRLVDVLTVERHDPASGATRLVITDIDEHDATFVVHDIASAYREIDHAVAHAIGQGDGTSA